MSLYKELKTSYMNFYEDVRDPDTWKVVAHDVIFAYSEFGRGLKQLAGMEEMVIENEKNQNVISNLEKEVESALDDGSCSDMSIDDITDYD